MSERIQDPGVGARLLEFFGIKGRSNFELERFILPTIQVGNLSSPGIPPVTRHCSARFEIAAAVGERFYLRMEVRGALLVKITDIFIHTPSDSVLYASFAGGTQPAALNTTFTDGRLTGTPAAIVGSDTQVGPIGTVRFETKLVGDVGQHISPSHWIIGNPNPNPADVGVFQIGTGNDNMAATGTIEWNEYPLI